MRDDGSYTPMRASTPGRDDVWNAAQVTIRTHLRFMLFHLKFIHSQPNTPFRGTTPRTGMAEYTPGTGYPGTNTPGTSLFCVLVRLVFVSHLFAQVLVRLALVSVLIKCLLQVQLADTHPMLLILRKFFKNNFYQFLNLFIYKCEI